MNNDEIREIWEVVKKNKWRTFLTAFGIFWGIFMLIILLGSGDGLEKGVINQFNSLSTNSFHIYSKKTRLPFKGVRENRQIEFTNEDYKEIRSRFENKTKLISARSYIIGKANIRKDSLQEEYNIYGVEPDIFQIRKVKLIEGRYINQGDIANDRNVVIIGNRVKEELFSNNNALGSSIKIEGTYYLVIGIFNSLREGEPANRENSTVFIPHPVFQKNFSRGMVINNFEVVTRSEKDERDIINFLKQSHKVHPDDNAIYGISTRDEFAKYQSLFKGIRIFIWIVGLGTLLSGLMGISNIMVINVNDRTKEIGIRKALGATPYSIIKMIVMEAMLLTGLSGYLGLAVGLALIKLVNYLLVKFHVKNEFFLNPEINLFVVVVSISIIILTGFIAALVPARKAAIIKPIKALKEI